MDKKTNIPIDLVTELPAVMTARAVEAERQRGEAVQIIEKPDTFTVDV